MTVSSHADIEAIEARPLADRNLPRNTFAAIAASALRTPDAPALSFFLSAAAFSRTQTWSYAALLDEITRAANLFHRLGVTRDAPVAFVLPNLPETHFTIWGGEAAGAVLAVNPLLEAGHIADLLRSARARVLVTLPPAPGGGASDLWARLAPKLAELPDLETVAWASLAPYLDEAGARACRAAESLERTGLPFAVTDLRAAMAEQPSDRLIPPAPEPKDRSSLFCTGGTTGLPKIAVRTHASEVFDAWAVGAILGASDTPRTFFCGLPLFHVNAQLVTGLLPWMRGDHVVLGTPEGYRGKDVIARFWEIAAHYRVSLFSGVPTIYAALLGTEIGANDLSALEFAICGAAPMPARLIASFEEKTGVTILEGYGLTEGACVSSLTPPAGECRAGSIGLRLPYQDMRAVILDDQGRFLRFAQVDEVGINAIRGPNIFEGYLAPEHNEGLWIDIGGERWMNTGDLCRQDADGYFWLSGRQKELIIRGGHNIDPKLIEEALSRHPAVALVAAVGKPDPAVGEVPVAHVQLKPDAAVTEEQLLQFAAQTIPERAAVPKHIRISASLPTTAVGKIFKPALLDLEIEATIREEAAALAMPLVSVQVERDARFGALARIHLPGDPAPLRTVLDRYVFRCAYKEDTGRSVS